MEVKDACDGDLLRGDVCMLDRGDGVVDEDCRYNEKSMAGGSSMRVGSGPVERRCTDFESV